MLKYVVAFFCALTIFAMPAKPQSARIPQNPQMEIVTGEPIERLEQQQVARLFAERQAQLRIDTAKLVALTAELKQQVDKTGPAILSMDVVKKAAEIQKLAKSVQDKMKNGY